MWSADELCIHQTMLLIMWEDSANTWEMKHKVSNCCLVYPLIAAPPLCSSMLHVGGWWVLQRYFHKHRVKQSAKWWHSRPDKLEGEKIVMRMNITICFEGAMFLTQSKRLIMLETFISPDSSVQVSSMAKVILKDKMAFKTMLSLMESFYYMNG